MSKYVTGLLLVIVLLLAGCAAPVAPAAPAGEAPAAGEAAATTEAAATEAAAEEAAPAEGEAVELTMGSWRTDDVEQMSRILAKFNEAYPNITINFDPTNPPDYNATLRTQLEGGTAPDLFYLRSFATSRQLFDEGFLEPLTGLPGLEENFTAEARGPWATEDGTPYGVPFIAVSHGIYYNQDIFEELGIAVPQTWEDLLAAAQTIQDAGYTPIANGAGDAWTIAEIVFMNIAPTFIGGYEGRQAYLSGERCFNDENSVRAFQAIAELAPFFPEGQQALTYYDSQQLFLQGEAAMWFGGSWDIPFFESEAPEFAWSVFPIPAPAGQDQRYVTFHLDAGMGVNAASEHKEEAKLFLEWMTGEEFAAMMANEMPGFFPIRTEAPAVENPVANAFLAFNEGAGLDVRWAWEKLLDGQPDGYTLMQDNAIAVLNGDKTAQEAADALQEGLATWFEPAQNCGQ
jgi:raffinose/stachyose/melibiose transport system substrate-binding protein